MRGIDHLSRNHAGERFVLLQAARRYRNRARARRQQTVCTICREELSTEHAATCANASCGALYHAECWSECVTHHHACAVMGCGSVEVHAPTTPARRRKRRYKKPVRLVEVFIVPILILVGAPLTIVAMLGAFGLAMALPKDERMLGGIFMLVPLTVVPVFLMWLVRLLGVEIRDTKPRRG